MRLLLRFAAFAGLCLTVGPALLLCAGLLDWSTHAHLMFAGMVLWFLSAPFAMKSGRARGNKE